MRHNYLILPTAILSISMLLVQTSTKATSVVKDLSWSEQLQDRQLISDTVIVVPSSRQADANDYYVSAVKKDLFEGDYYGALADHNKAIQLNPTYAKYYLGRAGLKRTRLNDFAGALADCNKAIKLDPGYFDAYSERAAVKPYLKDLTGAIEDSTIAIGIAPDISRRSEMYFWRGRLKYDRYLLKNERLDMSGALDDFNTAIDLEPNNHDEFYLYRGFLKSQLNDINGSVADFSKIINRNSVIRWDVSKAYYERGVLKKNRLGDNSGAIEDFRQALKGYRRDGKELLVKETLARLRELGATE
jgi:tetratricopeptide (TPR) repeat protein